MEPENNIQSGVSEVKPVTNEAPKEDIVFSNKPKKKTGMILGMVLFAILAIGGIGFGVCAWMDGNVRVDALNKQIEDFQASSNISNSFWRYKYLSYLNCSLFAKKASKTCEFIWRKMDN